MITGASSGIGESATLALVREGYEVIAGVRTNEDAERLRQKSPDKIHPLIMEVTDQAGMEKARMDAERIIGEGCLVAIFVEEGGLRRLCAHHIGLQLSHPQLLGLPIEIVIAQRLL